MLYDSDPYLMPFKAAIDGRHKAILACREKLSRGKTLNDAVNNHLYYGLHKTAEGGWVLREWAPNASRIYLIPPYLSAQQSNRNTAKKPSPFADSPLF